MPLSIFGEMALAKKKKQKKISVRTALAQESSMVALD